MQDLALNDGVRLVHIGPHKTGTTTIQGAFHLARETLAEHGVVYGGPGRQPVWAVLAVTGGKELYGERPPRPTDWTGLVDDVAAAGDRRVLVSSEFFADADDDAARRVVAELGGSRAHVVVTLRPLARIAASQWQQYVQNGLRLPLDVWLDAIFNKPASKAPTPTFWQRHRHDELVERWASAVGADNLTVVVADDADPMMLVHSFEALLGLPEGVLVPEAETTNRSLTHGEAEMLRLLNVEFKRLEWPPQLYARFLRYGSVLQLKTEHKPLPVEPRITLPPWAAERAATIGGEMAAKIEALGVRVVGDLSSLGRMPAGSGDVAPPPVLSPEAAAQAVFGAILGSGATDPQSLRLEARPVHEVEASNLVRVLARRIRRRAGRALHRGGADSVR